MPRVRLTGELVCRTPDETATVVEHLSAHILATRAEPGCLAFDVVQDASDPQVWRVEELFATTQDFTAHQRRAADSVWGLVTASIERRYSIENVAD